MQDFYGGYVFVGLGDTYHCESDFVGLGNLDGGVLILFFDFLHFRGVGVPLEHGVLAPLSHLWVDIASYPRPRYALTR